MDPYETKSTPCELYWAVQVRREEEWWHTSHLLAAIANLLAPSPISPEKFNPLVHAQTATPKPKGWAAQLNRIRKEIK